MPPTPQMPPALLETRFDPKKHGFHFSNNDTVWNVPGTPIRGKFLCGGMVYTALDYFYGHKPIPPRTVAPPLNHKLNRYIIARQNAAHVRTVSRMTLFSFLHDWYVESVAGEFDLIRKSIAAGRPVPLFLVKKDFLHGHHVLVTACRSNPMDAGPFLFIYDPNYPDKTASIARWGNEKLFRLNAPGGGGALLKGFFVDPNYSVHRPPDDLDPPPDPAPMPPPLPGPSPSPTPPPGPVPPPLPPPGPVSRTYTVKRGDNLSLISQRHYGTQARWRDIYAANRAVIGANPNLIHPGQVLTIPP